MIKKEEENEIDLAKRFSKEIFYPEHFEKIKELIILMISCTLTGLIREKRIVHFRDI